MARLRGTPPVADWPLPETTAVLADGAWQTARIATAALNLSEDGFQTRNTPRRALPPERQQPPLLGFTPDAWTPLPTEFDCKGEAAAGACPRLLHWRVALAGRPVDLFWWRPNRGGPLTWLRDADARHLGAMIADATGKAPAHMDEAGCQGVANLI